MTFQQSYYTLGQGWQPFIGSSCRWSIPGEGCRDSNLTIEHYWPLSFVTVRNLKFTTSWVSKSLWLKEIQVLLHFYLLFSLAEVYAWSFWLSVTATTKKQQQQQEKTNKQTNKNKTKQIDDTFSCACPYIYNKFRHNNVKVVYGSTRLR